MLKSMLERPALSMSELGLMLVGLVLTVIGIDNFTGAFTADRLAFLGGMIFLLAGAGCRALSTCAMWGHPRSIYIRVILMAVGWVGAAYPLSLAFTYFGSAYIAALPVAIAGMALALASLEKKTPSGANLA